MSDELDWNFSDHDDAKADIRAAVEYLLRGTTGGERGDIVQEIITIVRNVASGSPDPLDDGLPDPFDDPPGGEVSAGSKTLDRPCTTLGRPLVSPVVRRHRIGARC